MCRNLLTYQNPASFCPQFLSSFWFWMITSLSDLPQELGDLGLVAKASRSSQSLMRKPEALTVVKVFDTFRLIAKVPWNFPISWTSMMSFDLIRCRWELNWIALFLKIFIAAFIGFHTWNLKSIFWNVLELEYTNYLFGWYSGMAIAMSIKGPQS